jgi:hypothetical protein
LARVGTGLLCAGRMHVAYRQERDARVRAPKGWSLLTDRWHCADATAPYADSKRRWKIEHCSGVHSAVYPYGSLLCLAEPDPSDLSQVNVLRMLDLFGQLLLS